MRSLSILLLLAAPLAGCIGDSADLSTNDLGDDLPDAVGARVQSYLADGTPVAPPALPANPLYFLSDHVGAEPNIGITTSGAIFVSAFEEVIRSTDGGATWERVWVLGLEQAGVPEEQDPIFNSDPMLWVEPGSDRVYNVPMFPILLCSSIVWSDDDGASWTERPAACGIPYYDHQKFATGPPGPNASPLAGLAYPSVAYICYGQGATTECMVSYDGGLTWPVIRPAWTPLDTGVLVDCASQNGHPSVSHQGIVAFAKSWDCPIMVVVSDDSGLTWTVKPVADMMGEGIDPEVAFTPDGTMYVMFQADDHLTYVARSTDNGDSWAGPWRVSPPDVKSTIFAGMSAGDDGRIAMSFIGTRDTDEYPSEAPEDTRWHLYTVTSEDAGVELPTFTAYQVTPDEDPVQVGCAWIGGGGGGDRACRNMLDFIDTAIAPDGTFYVTYTEGCVDGCAGVDKPDEMDSRERNVAVARLDGFVLKTAVAEEPEMGLLQRLRP